MIIITADTRRARVAQKELLTSGSAGIPVQYILSEDWDDLTRVAVFRNDEDSENTQIDIALTDTLETTVPWEILQHPDTIGTTVYAGIYGTDGQGTIIIPTIWVSLGEVKEGAVRGNASGSDPTPDMWAQIQAIAEEAGEANALVSEGYAVGEQDGVPVTSGSDYYQNNSKYYNQQASTSASTATTQALKAEGFAVGEQNGTPVSSDSPYYENNAEYMKDAAAQYALAADASEGEAAAWATGSYSGDPSGIPVPDDAPQHNNNAHYYKEQAAASAAAAEAALEQFTTPTASASTLPTGSSATASYNNGNFAFGIPKGDKGDPGTDGTDGTDGVSPEVTITSITGGHTVKITDADHPTGQSFNVMDGTNTDADDVTYDPTETYTAGSVGAGLNQLNSDITDLTNNKADKVTGATAGHVAALDASGNLTDNGNKYQPVPKDDTMVIRVGADTAGRLWASGDSGAERFGVQGVGGSSTTLTRLWDAVGLTAAPGTDQVAAQSDFDAFAVFNRRKCVGSWSLQNDKPVFTVQAYEGDADYAEDGSMGDYVAVDVPPTYWYHDEANGILGVSGNAHPGWEPHPVCVDENGDVRAHTYIPVYPLALDGNGNAVSLPGYDPYFGSFKAVWDACKTYGDGSLANCVILEPSVVDHYEWLMMTIEFATTNMQTVMQGAVSMPYAASHTITAAPGANKIVLTAAIGDTCSVGQTLYIGSDHGATPSNVSAYNHITAIEKCDEDGTPNDSGTYRLITYDGTDRTASITPGTTKIGSRPWITGATAGFAPGVQPVLGHTGSPVSNSDARHPMRYRWRENVYGNINITALDLFNARTADGSSYHLDWYYNDRLRYEGPTLYYPSSASKPDLTDLQNAAKGFRKLSTTTPVASYKDGYIKEEGFDEDLPCIRVPVLTTGGSATTYFADYAYLVHSSAVRAFRRRGSVYSGAFCGPRFVNASSTPSSGYWAYGAALYMVQ